MFCKKCGNKIEEDDAVCSKCGTAVKALNQSSSGDTANTSVPQTPSSVRNPKAKKPQKKFLAFLGTGIVILAAAIALICYFNSAPYLYAAAVSYFDEGDYSRAEETFSRLGDYQDSTSLLAESKYQHAQECLESGDFDQALALLKEYEEYPDYKITRENEIIQCKEKIADAYRNQERYEDAVELYQALGRTWETAEIYAATENYTQALEITRDYSLSDSSEKETRNSWCRTQSIIYIEKGNYEDAWKCLKQYDKKSYDNELCQYAYQIACVFIDSKKYEEVLNIAEKIKHYMGNEAKLLESSCYEAQGIDYAQKGDYETAWKYFGMCEITDAGRPYLYTTGQFYMDQGSYSTAYTIWTALGNYQDSAEMMLKTRYEWAKSASAQGDYELAVQILQELGSYEDSGEIIKKTHYECAKAAYKQGDYYLAMSILEILSFGLGNYEDSAELLAEVEEKLYQKSLEEDKKTRRGVLEGTWKTEDGNLRIEVERSMSFKMPIQRSSVTTIVGTLYGANIKCGLKENIFDGASASSVEYGDILDKTYYWDKWDYNAKTLYLNASGGGWKTYSCTISDSTMTLTIDGKTFKLTRQ